MTRDDLIAFEDEIATKRRWSAANREKTRSSSRKHYAGNKKTVLAKQRDHYHQNREKILTRRRQRYLEQNVEKPKRYSQSADERRASSRERYALDSYKALRLTRDYRKRNPHVYAAHAAARRASKRQATPPWVNHAAIRAVYKMAAVKGLTVDHIVPLKHSTLCGLHVPWNLQLLSKKANSAKHNRVET